MPTTITFRSHFISPLALLFGLERALDRRDGAARFRAALRPALTIVTATLALVLAAGPASAVKRLYIANDDHTDYFWSGTDVQYRASFLAMLDFYMAQAEATATNTPDTRGRFNCDCSLWVWEYEHHKSAAEFSRLVSHMANGDISMPLNNAVLCYGGSPAEAVLRSMYYAGRLERRTGLRFPLALAMENQTLPGGLASLWAGSGALYSWRGVCGCASQTQYSPRPREIYQYLGPDGQGVCMKWNTQTGTWTGLGGYAEATRPSDAVNYLTSNSTYLSDWPWDVSGAFGHGGDSLQSTTNEFVNTAINYSNANQRVIVSNETDFFQDFIANHGDEIPTFSGSFGNEWELYQASLAAVTADFRREIEKLRTAEALATVASLHDPAFMTPRQSARDLAFMAAGLFYEHDWTADGPVPRATRMQFQRNMFAQLKAYVDPLYTDALAAVAARVSAPAGTQRLVVFNPLSWSRTDAVDLPVTFDPPVRVVDVATGAEVPSQVLTASPTVVRILASDVPSVGYRVYEVSNTSPEARPAAATVSLPSFDNGTYAVTLGSRGNVTSIVDHKDANRQLVDGSGGASAFDLGWGSGQATVESSGPVSTTLVLQAAGSPNHQARVTLYAGIDRIDYEGTITQNFGNSVAYGTRFDLAGSTLRHEEVGMIARVGRESSGGDYADENARTDYLSFGHFLDFSQASRGVTVSNADCSFFKAGNSTTTTLDASTPSFDAVVGMQVDGTSLGFTNQGGDATFLNRFSLRTHGAYDPAAAMRFALEHQNPLVTARATGNGASALPPSTWSLVSLPSSDILLWALKPAEEGIAQGMIARVWNLAEGARTLQLGVPAAPVLSAQRTTHIETNLSPASVTAGIVSDVLERQQLRTYRLMLTPESLRVSPGVTDGASLALSVYPNPLGRAVAGQVAFTLGTASRVRVVVRDVRGATVARVADGAFPAGRQTATWDRRDLHGDHVRPGIYFVEVEAGGARARQRIALLD